METCWEVGALLLVMTCDYECSARLSWRDTAYLDETGRHAGFVRYVRLGKRYTWQADSRPLALTNPVLVTAMANRLKSRTAR